MRFHGQVVELGAGARNDRRPSRPGPARRRASRPPPLPPRPSIARDDLLDFLRAHAECADLDHVDRAPVDVQVAVRVLVPEIAGAQPAVAQHLARVASASFQYPCITLGPRTHDLADVATRTRARPSIADVDLDARLAAHPPSRVSRRGPRAVDRSDARSGLGLPVHHEHAYMGQLLAQRLEQRSRHRAAGLRDDSAVVARSKSRRSMTRRAAARTSRARRRNRDARSFCIRCEPSAGRRGCLRSISLGTAGQVTVQTPSCRTRNETAARTGRDRSP